MKQRFFNNITICLQPIQYKKHENLVGSKPFIKSSDQTVPQTTHIKRMQHNGDEEEKQTGGKSKARMPQK